MAERKAATIMQTPKYQGVNATSRPRNILELLASELANQVNNPAAPVTLLQFRDIPLPSLSLHHTRRTRTSRA